MRAPTLQQRQRNYERSHRAADRNGIHAGNFAKGSRFTLPQERKKKQQKSIRTHSLTVLVQNPDQNRTYPRRDVLGCRLTLEGFDLKLSAAGDRVLAL